MVDFLPCFLGLLVWCGANAVVEDISVVVVANVVVVGAATSENKLKKKNIYLSF